MKLEFRNGFTDGWREFTFCKSDCHICDNIKEYRAAGLQSFTINSVGDFRIVSDCDCCDSSGCDACKEMP